MKANILLWLNQENQPNTPVKKENVQDANLFSISMDYPKETALKVREKLKFEGNVIESESGKSYICFKAPSTKRENEVTITLD